MSDKTMDDNWNSFAEQLKWDDSGLIPAIVQDAISKEVLMLAFMNRESLQRSLETGETWFWSRSRRELWHKGATSGNIQKIREIRYDCDGDTLLVLVEPEGPACHTGKYSCFYRRFGDGSGAGDSAKTAELAEAKGTEAKSTEVKGTEAEANEVAVKRDRYGILNELESVIASREAERPEGSYTTYLFDKGVDKILKKIGEEAGEVIIAAKNRDHDELSWEASDLLFHLLVLLREQKLPLDRVLQELESRHMRPKE